MQTIYPLLVGPAIAFGIIGAIAANRVAARNRIL
jgi:hypothetical protein